MKKDAYYFPHDSNAKDDPKCVLLIEQLGLEGYGIYWMLIETLREQPEYKYPVNLLPALARRYNTTPEKVKTVVGNYGLFVVEDDTVFFSQSLIARMIPLERKREQARLAGLKSAEKRLLTNVGSTDVLRSFIERSTSKVNKSKTIPPKGGAGGRVFIKPSIVEVEEYCKDRSNGISASEFVDYYESNGWRVGRSPMKDWQAAVRSWENKRKENKPTTEIPHIDF